MNDKSGCSSKSVLSSRSLLKVTLYGIFPQENLSISKDHSVDIAEHGSHTSELKMFDLLSTNLARRENGCLRMLSLRP